LERRSHFGPDRPPLFTARFQRCFEEEERMKRTISALGIVSVMPFSFVLLFAQNQVSSLNINVRDYCDPTTFNAAVGPGTCVRDTTSGLITFPGFLAELGADKSVVAPDHAKVAEGATLNLQSLGGETHRLPS
jgi:hypothetical protein